MSSGIDALCRHGPIHRREIRAFKALVERIGASRQGAQLQPFAHQGCQSFRRLDAVIAANPDVADKIRDGKVQAAGALIGQVMREMKGQADAGAARAIILERLGQS